MKFFLLTSILGFVFNAALGQPTKQKRTYPRDVDKIDNIRSSYTGCTVEHCSSWWSIALRNTDELLMQHGGHHPAAAKTRHFPAGTWRIDGDTLKLNIGSKALRPEFMRTKYRIANLYGCELLLPLDGTEDCNMFLNDLKSAFEQSAIYHELQEFKGLERVIPKAFSEFVSRNYSYEKKVLVARVPMPGSD